LDEHHDRGDSRARDFDGVVKGAGREAMRFRAGFRNGFVAEGNEVVVEQDRCDRRVISLRLADFGFTWASRNSTA
jgi:hypothetical protein